jgi:hypothetical protein
MRKSGSDVAGPLQTRGDALFLGWGVDSDMGSPKSSIDAGNLETGRPNLEHVATAVNAESRLRAHSVDGQSESSIDDSSTNLDADEISHSPGPLFKFANWAFGLDGLPSLQVLAFGDFSYDGRFQFYNHVFCRHAWSFRTPDTNRELTLTFRPISLWFLIHDNRDFLESCPAESIAAD